MALYSLDQLGFLLALPDVPHVNLTLIDISEKEDYGKLTCSARVYDS